MVAALKRKKTEFLDLSDFRRRFPATVANLGAIPNREIWLRRIEELDQRWRKSFENGLFADQTEVLTTGTPPANLEIEGEFEIVYAGGGLGLLHAAVMSVVFRRKVLVFDAHSVGRTHRDWNISDEELTEFVRAGLFTKEELEKAIVNRYQTGFVKFHDANSRFKTPPLYMDDVLNVALEADALLQLAAGKVKNSNTDSVLLDSHKFIRAYIQPDKALIETEDSRTGKRKLFAARLFVDATGTNSPASRQLNENRSITHVCPTVGTVARGFVRGSEPQHVNFKIGEILVSTEDASDHRQLIWEGFAGSLRQDEYTTYLFFYDSVDSKADKSLLALFEEYFEKLPLYKQQSSNWRVVKPVFGYIPSYHHHGWNNQKRTADTRVLLIGDAAGLSSPLTFCGFGSHVRNLRRLTHLTHLALKADATDSNSLCEINAYEPRVAHMSSLAEFMRPTPKSRASVVNETMNAVMAALTNLDERVRRDLFKDRISFDSFKSLLAQTAKIHPAVFKRMIEHLGFRGSFWWIANIAEAALHERKTDKSNVLDSTQKDAGDADFAKMLEFYKNQTRNMKKSDFNLT